MLEDRWPLCLYSDAVYALSPSKQQWDLVTPWGTWSTQTSCRRTVEGAGSAHRPAADPGCGKLLPSSLPGEAGYRDGEPPGPVGPATSHGGWIKVQGQDTLAPHLQGVVWAWPQSGLGLKRVREPKAPPVRTQVWGGRDTRGSSNCSAPLAGSGVSRGGCTGRSPSMPCSSAGTPHHHSCPAPLQGNSPTRALFPCRDTFPLHVPFPCRTCPCPPPCSPLLLLHAGRLILAALISPCLSAPSLCSPCCPPPPFLTQPCQKQAGKAQAFRSLCATFSPSFPI